MAVAVAVTVVVVVVRVVGVLCLDFKVHEPNVSEAFVDCEPTGRALHPALGFRFWILPRLRGSTQFTVSTAALGNSGLPRCQSEGLHAGQEIWGVEFRVYCLGLQA